ncbi:hypothetical protein [Streptomyces sp. MB09-02B]|uniref:hypothetical protein n=1 Tax=Streptomyces sp. MB09-02B TaxID=3028667 RepID=UPI0029ADFFBF|nr:hypothetical protein [Streptomyces sp. MB09-02B]MDX3638420.1 hypothetical protein [Streptomyces sp. MB09-02B]
MAEQEANALLEPAAQSKAVRFTVLECPVCAAEVSPEEWRPPALPISDGPIAVSVTVLACEILAPRSLQSVLRKNAGSGAEFQSRSAAWSRLYRDFGLEMSDVEYLAAIDSMESDGRVLPASCRAFFAPQQTNFLHPHMGIGFEPLNRRYREILLHIVRKSI